MRPEQKLEGVFNTLQKYGLPLYEPIIALPPEDPTEVIIELDPTSKHPEYSVAAALLFLGKEGLPSGSVEHFHPEGTEFYKVTSGEVVLFTRHSSTAKPDRRILRTGESAIIEAHVLHRAEPVGDNSEVIVFSHPGWTPDNHKFIEDFPKS